MKAVLCCFAEPTFRLGARLRQCGHWKIQFHYIAGNKIGKLAIWNSYFCGEIVDAHNWYSSMEDGEWTTMAFGATVIPPRIRAKRPMIADSLIIAFGSTEAKIPT